MHLVVLWRSEYLTSVRHWGNFGTLILAVAARHGYREIVDDAGEQNSVAADTVAHACPLSRRTAVDTIARAACAYGAIVSKIQWPYEL